MSTPWEKLTDRLLKLYIRKIKRERFHPLSFISQLSIFLHALLNVTKTIGLRFVS